MQSGHVPYDLSISVTIPWQGRKLGFGSPHEGKDTMIFYCSTNKVGQGTAQNKVRKTPQADFPHKSVCSMIRADLSTTFRLLEQYMSCRGADGEESHWQRGRRRRAEGLLFFRPDKTSLKYTTRVEIYMKCRTV